MATIRIDISSENRARQEILNLRQQITDLNSQLARNNQQALTANATQRQALQEQNRRIRAEQGLLRVNQQRQSIALATLREESGLLANVRQQTTLLQRATGGLTGAVGGLGTAFSFLAVDQLVFQLRELTAGSVRAAAELEGYQRGLRVIEGSQAPERLQQLIEVANLPGLQLSQLINYSNQLRAIGLTAEETDSILLTTGQTILAMGGTSDVAAAAVLQITQALQSNTVSLQDFRAIAQRIPGFYNAIAETHDVEASIDGFRVAVDRAGGSVKDALLPVMDTLAMRFGTPPSDSYVVAVDALQNSFFLLQAEIGQQFLPTIAQTANALATFFDAIRENNLGELPAPIQAIVQGAQSLFNALVSVGETIARHIGPELEGLLPALGSVLGSVLDLAGALVNALRPAYDLIAPILRVQIALVVKLAEDVGALIGGIADFVNWLTGASREQETFNTTTQQTAATVQNATTAVQNAGQMTGEYGQNLTNLQSELTRVNTELDAKRQRLDELSQTATSTAHPAVQQLTRQVAELETQSASLTGQIGTLREEFTNIEAPAMGAETATRGFVSSIDDFGGALTRIDTRFLTFHERTEALSGAIRELPPELTAVRNEFDVLAPTAARVAAVFEDIETSVVDLEEEERALNLINSELHGGLTTTAVELGTLAHNANLVNPAISEGVESFRNYANIIGDVNLGYDEIIPATQDFVDGLVRQESAFDDLREAAEAAEISLDDIDTTFNNIPDAIDPSIISMEDFETVALRALRDIGDELSVFEGGLGDVGLAVDNLVTLFSNPISFAAGTLGNVIEGLANLENFGGALGLPEGFFDDPTPGAEVIRGGQTLNEARYQDFVDIVLGRRGGYEDPIGFLLENAPGLIEQFRPLIDVDPRLGSPDIYNRLFPQATGPISSFTRSPDFDVNAEYAATFDDAAGETAGAIVETATETVMEATEPLLEVFRFTGAQRGVLRNLSGDIETAENTIRNLTDESTPEEVIAAYQGLAIAEQAYTNQQLAFINAGEGVFTDTALETARTGALTDLTNRAFDANTTLVGALEDVGFELVNAFTATSGILSGSALAFQRIPEMVEEAVTDIEAPAQELQTPEPTELSDAFRFTNEQRRLLAPLLTEITNARQAISLLTEDSTPEEITAAYTRFGEAEAAYRNRQIEFIDAGVGTFTSGALQEARDRATNRFDQNLFSANTTLVRNLENVGFELTTMFDETSGFLMGTALAFQRIPIPEPPTAEAEATTEAVEEATPLSPAVFAQNRLQDAQFGIRTATTETDFDTAVENAITATNTYYDLEETRLEGLGLAEDVLRDKREDNERARLMALFRLENIENPFREQRLRDAETEANQQMRIRERQEREAQRAIETRLREEMRLHDTIEGLRDDAIEAEQRRADRLVDIHTRSTRQISDLQRGLSRNVEDFFRDTIGGARLRDIQSGNLGVFFGQFTDALTSGLAQGMTGIDVLNAFSQERGLVNQDVAQLFGLDFRQLSGLDDLITPFARGVEDVGISATRAAEDANIQAQMALTEIQQQVAMTESETAALTSTTAVTDAENAMMLAMGVEMLGTAASDMLSADIPESVQSIVEATEGTTEAIAAFPNLLEDSFLAITDNITTRFAELAQIETGIRQGAQQAFIDENPQLFATAQQPLMVATHATPTNFATINIGSASISVGTAEISGTVNQPPVNLQADVMLDKQKVGEAVGDTIRKQQLAGDSLI